ncbi:MAG: YkgJ family cysteine cluster protein [Terracidiphilus sp.]|nr:YkgJ family cysteine cluster protein [Terracidiphilus sp.]
MKLPADDAKLVQVVDTALADAAQRAGAWLACRPGCTPCCHGAFAINALDVARLQAALERLRASNPEAAEAVETRARLWWAEWSAEFPGDRASGILGTSDDAITRFEDYANEAACPALDTGTGLCAVYDGRPMTCRVFGPPVRMGAGESLGCCELCFAGATEAEIASCEMPVPHELEAQLLAGMEQTGDTVVAFALLPATQKKQAT